MPKGEGQSGKRRGKYTPRKRAGDEKQAKPVAAVTTGEWTSDDDEHYRMLVDESPLASEPAKRNAARRATELSRQLRVLDARVRTIEEEKALIAASSQYRRWLEVLQVAVKVKDDDEDL